MINFSFIKKISVAFGLLMVTFFSSASIILAQNNSFPIQAIAVRKDNAVTVSIINTASVDYKTRASLFITDSTSAAPKGNDYDYVVLKPNQEKKFVFSGLQSKISYDAYAIATSDTKTNIVEVSPNKIFKKKFELKGTVSNATEVPVSQAPTSAVAEDKQEPTPQQNPLPQNNATFATYTPQESDKKNEANECNDGVDNNDPPDGKADRYGVYDQNGKMIYEPDPSCFSPNSTVEVADDVASSIIPCTDKCTFSDVFRLLNNILKFFITVLLVPIFVLIIMYAGFKYFKAGASAGQKADVKKMFGNIVLGMVLILCAWLIVNTLMKTLLNDEFRESGVEFLGD